MDGTQQKAGFAVLQMKRTGHRTRNMSPCAWDLRVSEWHPMLSVGEAMGPHSIHLVASIPFLVSMGHFQGALISRRPNI